MNELNAQEAPETSKVMSRLVVAGLATALYEDQSGQLLPKWTEKGRAFHGALHSVFGGDHPVTAEAIGKLCEALLRVGPDDGKAQADHRREEIRLRRVG